MEEEARQEKEKLARIQRQVEFEAAQEKLLKAQQVRMCTLIVILCKLFFVYAMKI